MSTLRSPILRLVRMQFRPEALADFDALFTAYRDRIAAAPGCVAVTCLPDVAGSLARTTVSVWRAAEDLETYRQSPLFREVWSKTKTGFSAPPHAFSLVAEGMFFAAAAAYLGPPNDSTCWP
ncbi:MAG: putative quinol monooxygenase [Flavobacteriales bacterium]